MSLIRRLNHTLTESLNSAENLHDTAVSDAGPRNGSFFSFVSGNYGAFVGIVLALIVILTFGLCVLNEYFRRKYGIDICRGQRLQTLRRRSAALQARRVADGQRETEEIEREQRKMERRRARRERYSSMLKSVTMTLQEENFRCAEGSDHDKDILIFLQSAAGPNEKEISFPAQCTVCLSKYEAGDTVIWSTNSACQHCYHEECILMWLSTGKRRCPSCRQTFAEPLEKESNSGRQVDVLDLVEPNVSDGEDDILIEVDEEECENHESESMTEIQIDSPPTESVSAES